MDGSIRFNNDINIEVAVDPTAEEGARLTGAKNLVDGQELGTGSDLPVVTEADAGKVLAVNASGEWAAENKLVRLIVDPDTYLSNLTAREVIQAFMDGAIVYEAGGTITEDPSECGGGITIFSAVEYNVNNKYELLNNNSEMVAMTPDNSLDSYFNFD